jgi:3-methyladenine DNA glycosylase Mpg
MSKNKRRTIRNIVEIGIRDVCVAFNIDKENIMKEYFDDKIGHNVDLEYITKKRISIKNWPHKKDRFFVFVEGVS